MCIRNVVMQIRYAICRTWMAVPAVSLTHDYAHIGTLTASHRINTVASYGM